MTDFKLIVDFLFDYLSDLFSLITQHWLLSLFVLVWVFALIVELVLTIKGSR